MGRRSRTPKLDTVLADPIRFASRLSIVDKNGLPTRLKLRDEQVAVLESIAEGNDLLVLKPRQIGLTTACSAAIFHKWFTATGPSTFVILSHKLESSKHILTIHKRFYEGLPSPLQRELSVNNTTVMQLADTGARIIAMSAEGKGGLRSFTANAVHISEFAFQENADELLATAIASLNGGQLIIESTANYYGDPLHRQYELFEAEVVKWDFKFFPWTDHVDYQEKPPPGWQGDDHSDLSWAQQYWSEKMEGKLGPVKFKREYPLTVDEAYAQVDGAWFSNDLLEGVNIVKGEVDGILFERKVEPNDRYAIGVDAGAGTGGDYSTVVVLSKQSGQIVEIRRSNSHSPTHWAEVVIDASRKWNNAKVLVESNGTWGGVILTELKYNSVPLWKTGEGADWITNAVTKPKMFEALKDYIARGQCVHLDAWTAAELRSFKVDDRGNPFVPRKGAIHHGDTVTAWALSLQCLENVNLPKDPWVPQWVKERKAQQTRDRLSSAQHRRY